MITERRFANYPRRGEIYRAFAHGKEGRPVLIISPDGRNEYAHECPRDTAVHSTSHPRLLT
ncbi:MAG: hypothetical protein DMG07_17215 [Acidobacteria bacterium]|nr:MAG: hypothetical protein DMG07_17215 [Acidobacteriota bacterium]